MISFFIQVEFWKAKYYYSGINVLSSYYYLFLSKVFLVFVEIWNARLAIYVVSACDAQFNIAKALWKIEHFRLSSTKVILIDIITNLFLASCLLIHDPDHSLPADLNREKYKGAIKMK